MLRRYDPAMPSDVRQFVQEIARLTASGPIGAEQAARYIRELGATIEGNELLRQARLMAKIQAESFGTNFSNVKVYSDSNSYGLGKTLGAQAFVSGNQIAISGDSSGDMIAHELTHVVQQGQASGKK